MENTTVITVEALVNVQESTVWALWTNPEHIVQWNTASADWHTTKATNDLQVGGRFSSHMAAKDGSFGFDFSGTYTNIRLHQTIAYMMDDGRTAEVTFSKKGEQTFISTRFDAENENPVEMQQAGWQAILNSFKAYAERK
jgi:uncharacterized protein YndB with AHSA1/START domain